MMIGENGSQAAPAENPQTYENEHGVACLAPYVRVFDWPSNGAQEVGAVVQGQRMDMSEVAKLNPTKLAAEGVVLPEHVVSMMHAAAAERHERYLRDWRHSSMPQREETNYAA